MAENKKSVLLYCDLIHTIEGLKDVEAGKLFKHFLRYVNDLNPTPPDRLTDIVFEPIKQNLKRDLKKWDTIKSKRSDAGKVSADKRKQQKLTNPTHVESVEQYPTNPTVTVNDTVTVNVINKEIFENLKFELFNSSVWISDCERTLKTQKIKMFLTEFLDEIYLKEDYFKPIQEAKSHFVSWVKIKLKNIVPQSNHAQDGLL